MLEMALVLPVALLVVFGSIEFGLIFSRYQVLLGATARAARVASTFRSNCNPAIVARDVQTEIAANTELGIGLDLTNPAFTTVTLTNLCLPGSFVTVEIEYRHQIFLIAGLMEAFTGTPLVEIPLRTSVRMLNEA